VSQVGTALESSYTSIVMVNEDGTLGVGSEEYVDIPSSPSEPPDQRHEKNSRHFRPLLSLPATRRDQRDNQQRTAHLVDNVDATEGTNPVLLAAGIKSYAGVPIKVKNTIIGVLFVHSTRKSASPAR